MRWVYPLSPEIAAGSDVLGGKAHGLVVLRRLGLPVPPGFVIGTEAGRAYLRHGRLPDGLDDELAVAVAELEATTHRRLGGPERPLAVSVRSGGSVSMPGMMTTILNLGLTAEATAGLAAETGDPAFARDSRRRLLASFAAITGGAPIPNHAIAQLKLAVAGVFSSWDTPRAATYRELNGIPHDLGTAVTVQAMVFGNRDDHSGAGVAFSRDPNTGRQGPFGELLFGRQGDDVVSGGSLTRPLHDLADRAPAVWAGLLEALRQVEEHHRDACYLEFTFEAGQLWLLQARPGRFAGAAAVRVAVDLADEGVIGRHEALLRISPRHLQLVRVPRLVAVDEADVLARGLGAVPGVAVGRVATTADRAIRMAAAGPVILVRPVTSPQDLPGLAAAAGVVTARGGPASHAAVVARAMGKPAVVGAAGLAVAGASVRAGGRAVPEGTGIAIDGTGGEVVMGTPQVAMTAADPRLRRLLDWADEVAGGSAGRGEAERLGAAHAVLRPGASIP
jgi:pyruvate,orthophosphate dikinase